VAEGIASNDRWHVRKDGSRLWVNGTLSSLWDESGCLRGFVKVCRDLTESRRVSLAVQDARAYAVSIVETVREAVVVLDADLRVKSANRAFYRTFQISPEVT